VKLVQKKGKEKYVNNRNDKETRTEPNSLPAQKGKEKYVNNRNDKETRTEPNSLPALLHHSEELIGHHSEKVQILKVTQPNAP